ncbi:MULTISPECIES: alpha/beta hydrolase [Oenococcus]|uniref:Cell surface hydrolase (Putative) n=1 Tax=Oenococcus kitaharae DSM 17330 TaxID=1045004 RepID=G9WJJ9_9LACO|nr:alpha/beta hydrolase [Oenococcus kitaharae]EHN59044.1 cell surface hydrolase (putative) [Oenococcus kitaharae DSM 17330]OEY83730.1 alpha/beta hydrolase [Oenococcus kitaharae]OEY83902.1 alpha/beta hydrolase [Oenococcus kitaharae]OEY84178.1 alpha/beta hydrolase [Oenococcus kitaharae]
MVQAKGHNKKILLIITAAVLLLFLFVLAYFLIYGRPAKAGNRAKSVPTLYLHGFGGTANSSNDMIAYAVKHQGATKVLTARVSPFGKVHLQGSWPKNAKQPLIQVLFQNNRNGNYNEDGRWLRNILQDLRKNYQIKRVNVVAHSMGNLALMYYQLADGNNPRLPQINKQVDIAGHFDGIVGIDDQPNRNRLLAKGRPRYLNSYYRVMLARRNRFPENRVDILNIFGNLENGSNSDGDVTNVSARSLKYLLNGRYKSYREVEIKGRQAQHSRLHRNNQVNRLIGRFLWNK